MFEDKERNRKMIIGAYKKLKSYFYYDKTILYNKMRLATWESNEIEMNKRIEDLADFLSTLEVDCDYEYVKLLMSGVGFVPMPKAFKEKPIENNLLQNKISDNNEIDKVNFFIRAPIELMIIDTIWMLMIGKIASEQNSISPEAYANKIKKQIFFSSHDLFEGIDFSSNRLFVPYFKQYTIWRDNAFRKVKTHYEAAQDSILLSLDLKGYYYSVSFKFDELSELLNHDERLTKLAPLTAIIEMVYMIYTSEMKKYRSAIRANPFIKECIFPIGLLSSMLLSNLYLQRFDKSIKERIQPSYYGRYVDDIMIVMERSEDMLISVESILHESLVKNNIIKPIGNSEYQTINPTGLIFQKNKMRCVYFDHTEPDAMIKLLCETNTNTPSGVELMPDVNISQRTFDESAYNLGQQTGALKVRNFLFTTNNYAATLFVNDLIRTSKNVDTGESEYQTYLNSQINQIIKFYSGTQSIEYRSAWINVFTLILLTERYDLFCKFYCQIRDAIANMTAVSIESIAREKIETICDSVRIAMTEQLNLSVSIALAPMAITVVSDTIKNEFTLIGVDVDFSNVIQDALDIRNANLFNNHVLSFPLINYVDNNDNGKMSLVKAQPKDIVNPTMNGIKILPLNQRKVSLSPRFIHLDEICMLNFLINFTSGGFPSAGDLGGLINKFYEINQIHSTVEEFVTEKCDAIQRSELNLQQIKIVSTKRKSFEKFRIAIASICLDENRDIIPTIDDPKHNLTPQKKAELYAMLNEAASSGANMIVFPEFFLPVEWIEDVYTFSRKNSIAVISGLRYIIHDKHAYNYLVVIQPASSEFGFRYTLPLLREKNHYAPAEFEILKKHGIVCADPAAPYTHLISWNKICYSDLMCYELTDIGYRCKLRSKIELLLVPELNPDTEYFSNIVEATSRDLHCFIVQVNSSKYGDSRITGPFNSMFKDIVKIKGGENNVLLMGTVNVKELLESRVGKADEKEEKPNLLKRRMKKPSAGFSVRKEGVK